MLRIEVVRTSAKGVSAYGYKSHHPDQDLLKYFYSNPFRNNTTLSCNFVRSGWIGIDVGRLRSTGTDGFWWSASLSTQSRAADLYISQNTVRPSYSDSYDIGFPLRCLAD